MWGTVKRSWLQADRRYGRRRSERSGRLSCGRRRRRHRQQRQVVMWPSAVDSRSRTRSDVRLSSRRR